MSNSRREDDDGGGYLRINSFKYVLPEDEERLHLSDDSFNEEPSATTILCGDVPTTSGIGWSLKVPIDTILELPTRQRDEEMIYPLRLPVCPLCMLIAQRRINERRAFEEITRRREAAGIS